MTLHRYCLVGGAWATRGVVTGGALVRLMAVIWVVVVGLAVVLAGGAFAGFSVAGASGGRGRSGLSGRAGGPGGGGGGTLPVVALAGGSLGLGGAGGGGGRGLGVVDGAAGFCTVVTASQESRAVTKT